MVGTIPLQICVGRGFGGTAVAKDQGYGGREVPPIFTPGSKPEKGILYYNK